MKVDKIPYVSLDYRVNRDEYKNWEFSHVYSDDYYIINAIDRQDNGFQTHNLVELEAQTYTPKMKDKIYFMKGVTVPRVKLKDLAVKYKIRTTTDIDKATVVVGSSNASDKLVKNKWLYSCNKHLFLAAIEYFKEKEELDAYYVTQYEDFLEPFKDDDNIKSFYTDWKTASLCQAYKRTGEYPKEFVNKIENAVKECKKNNIDIHTAHSSYVWSINDENLEFLNTIKGKTIIEQNGLLQVINGDDCTTIDEDTYQNLRNMFQSSDSDNHVMAMEIMANCNYKESILYLYLLFHHHWDYAMSYSKTKNHVNFKSLRNYLGIGNYFHAGIDTVIKGLIEHNCLDNKALNVIVDEFKNYLLDNGHSSYIKPKIFSISEEFSKETNLSWASDLAQEVKQDNFSVINEVTEDSVEENIANEDTVEEVKEKDVEQEPEIISDEDVEEKVVNAIQETIKTKQKNEETADNGFDWF